MQCFLGASSYKNGSQPRLMINRSLFKALVESTYIYSMLLLYTFIHHVLEVFTFCSTPFIWQEFYKQIDHWLSCDYIYHEYYVLYFPTNSSNTAQPSPAVTLKYCIPYASRLNIRILLKNMNQNQFITITFCCFYLFLVNIYSIRKCLIGIKNNYRQCRQIGFKIIKI